MAIWRRTGNLLGVAIGLLGLGFVVFRLADDWPAVLESLVDADWWLIGLSLLLGLAGMTTIGMNWRYILRSLDVDLPRTRTTIHQYFVGQLGKYVPGGIWPVVGRAEMAARGGASRTLAYAGTLLSLAATYLAALLTAGLLLGVVALRGETATWEIWLLVLIPIGLGLLHPSVFTRVVVLMSRVLRREIDLPTPRWSESMKMVVLHVPAWLAISAATYSVSSALGGELAFDRIGVATCIAWFLGFVVVGLPGGIGVREAVFVSLAGPLGPAMAAAVALVARVVFVLVDLVGAFVSTGIHWTGSSERSKSARG